MQSLPTPLRILVVDDVPSARKVLVGLLRKLGYDRIAEAQTGEEAVSKVNAVDFDLVIADFHLPDMNGDMIAKAVHQKNSTTKTQFILVSVDEKSDLPLVFDALDAAFLAKPFSVSELEQTLRSVFPMT